MKHLRIIVKSIEILKRKYKIFWILFKILFVLEFLERLPEQNQGELKLLE